MVGHRREIRVAAVVGIVAAIGVGLFAGSEYWAQHLMVCGGSCPILLAGLLSTEGVSCTVATGICNMTIVNTSGLKGDPGADVSVVGCSESVVLSGSGSNTTWHSVSGTVGGQATIDIPAKSSVAGTCTISTSESSHQSPGSFLSGEFMVSLLNQYYSHPPGTLTGVGFEGSWT